MIRFFYMLVCDENPDMPRKWNGLDLPKPGDVDLLLAGPPCQGFSLLNRYVGRDSNVGV
jgi:site-specific DNA-cytosine methylase